MRARVILGWRVCAPRRRMDRLWGNSMANRGGILLALYASVFIASPSSAQQPKRGGNLIFALSADPDHLNRDLSSDGNNGLVSCIIYQGLTRVGGDGAIKPELAKSWTISPDGLTYTFQLNQANWEDGKPFTSEDVKFTLLEVSSKYSAVFSQGGAAIASIETPAPDQVVFHLKYSYGPFLRAVVCLNGGAILPAHIYRGTDILRNPANSKPVGLGPFLLKEWVRGAHITLRRNPNYWEPGKPYLDEVIARILPSNTSRTQALMAGEVDFVSFFYLPTSDYPAIKANPNLVLKTSKLAPAITFIALNVARPIFADIRVRQALMMGTDRDYIVQTAFQGNGSVATMPFTNRIGWAADPAIDYNKMYPFDVARANALLDEAGKKRGPDGTRFKLDLVYNSSDPQFALVATATKIMWQAVGVEATILPVESASSLQRVFVEHNFDATITSYTSLGDPALGMARMAISSSIGKPLGNGSQYSNPEVDALLDKGAKATSEQERGAYYRQAQDILAKELPFLTLHERVLYDGMAKTIHGFDDEDMYPIWRNAWHD
jgi:peptide/nickel transport system substrate-binding protein